MQLTLSTFKPINATYTDTESGVDRYKVHTEISVIHGTTTTISRRIDGDIPRRDGEEPKTAGHGERFGQLAHISWRVIGSTPWVIRLVFTGQDGKEYKWTPQVVTTTLNCNDGVATLVAVYHAKDLLHAKERAWLEILPPFEHMADEIVVTLAYMEKIRKS
ncbi:hypothetical protein C8R46DRAFT_1283270 [Mycena filopes]|nr:hypothetical protein C8R46DRAFT_1283270 [Mycena filopes]